LVILIRPYSKKTWAIAGGIIVAAWVSFLLYNMWRD